MPHLTFVAHTFTPTHGVRPMMALLALLISAVSAFGQSGPQVVQAGLFSQASQASQAGSGLTRRLTMDEAVALALQQNLGIQIERINPQIQDLSILQARTGWTPTFTSTLTNGSTNNPSTSALSGGASTISDSRLSSQLGVQQMLKTGTSYNVTWDSSRATSNSFFNNFDPQIRSGLSFNVTQPLLRNFKIDSVRQQIEVGLRDREGADVQLQSTIASTTRNVRNAYWDLAYQMASLNAAQQSLELARRLLADNQKRVQIGTMAPIDIVEAESEVARNDEAVIVAEAGIKQAEDRLRALIFDPAAPDFWTVTIEPIDALTYESRLGAQVDVDAAVRRALDNRTDIQQSKNNLARTDINLQFQQNQKLPEINAQASYSASGVGGVQLTPLNLSQIPTGPVTRAVVAQRAYGSVLGDVLLGDYPAWTVGVTVAYPIGTSASEANLARFRLQQQREQTELRNLELQVATQVRDLARQVQTNQKRIDSARAARELAERRLEAEEKKFAAGIQTSFFVFQAQRDLAQSRTNYVRTVADYAKSVVDFDAVQQTPLR